MQKLLIDTDPGEDIDDLLALAFALQRPELEVCAITTVTQPAAGRARLVRRLLRYLDRTDIPVAAGMSFPLRPLGDAERRRQGDFRQTMNHAAFAEPEDPRDAPEDLDAPGLIIRTVERHPGEVALAGIAPLTNLAVALQRRPEIAGQIAYVAMMGGETALNRVEHNVAFDPVAADLVLRAGIPLFMGTWDVTRRVVLSLADDGERLRRHRSPLCQALARAIDDWHPAQSWKPGPVLYDLFPIVHAFDRSYYSTTPQAVRVETRGEFTTGMTVLQGGAPNAEVTTGVRAAEVRELFLATLLA